MPAPAAETASPAASPDGRDGSELPDGAGVRAFVDGTIYGLQPTGGISLYFDEILPRLAAAGVGVNLLTRRRDPPAGPPAGPRLTRPRRDPLSSVRGVGRLPGGVRRALERREDRRWARRVDAAAGGLFHPTYYTTLPLRRAPAVVTVYDMIHELFPALFAAERYDRFRDRKRACVTAARRVLAISESAKADLCRLYDLPPERVDATPLAVDATVWRARAAAARASGEADGGEPCLLYVGTRSHHKNFAGLLGALGRWDGRADYRLAIVGAPLTDAERAAVDRAGVRVSELGRLSDDALAAAYAGAAAFVYPSLYEGFGLPPLEAMACGAPVLAARTGSIPEVVGDAAELFDPDEPDAFTHALARVVDPARAEELREAGARQVGRFSWDRTAALTLASYRRALS